MAATFIVLPAGGQLHGMRATSVGAASISHRMPPFPRLAHAPSAQTTIVIPSHTLHVLIFTTVVPPPYPTRVAVRSISWTQQRQYVTAVGVRWPYHRAMVVIADGEGIRKGIVVRKVFAGVIRPSRYTLVRHPLIVGARIPGGMRVVPAMGRARQKLHGRIVVRTKRQEITGAVGLMPLQRRR